MKDLKWTVLDMLTPVIPTFPWEDVQFSSLSLPSVILKQYEEVIQYFSTFEPSGKYG